MIKPDGVQRGLIGKVINRMERKGLKIVALKMVNMDRTIAEELYDIHKGKGFFESLMDFVTSAPVVVMVLEGENAVEVVRRLIGATKSFEALPGTVRGDLGLTTGKNVVHASDAPERAKYEMNIFFKDMFIDYQRIDEEWIYE